MKMMLHLNKPRRWVQNPTIQVLRGISVLLVFISHTSFAPKNSNFGAAGVGIFFVISGYVITGKLQQKTFEMHIQDKSKIKSLLRYFYSRRARRLIPISYFVAFAVVILETFTSGENSREYLLALVFIIFYIPNLFGISGLGFTDLPDKLGHYWSLGVEEQFYMIWPIIFLFCFKKGPKYSVRVTSVLIGIFFTMHFIPPLFNVTVWTLPTTYLDLLLIGCILSIFRTNFDLNLTNFSRQLLSVIQNRFVLCISLVGILMIPQKSILNVFGGDYALRAALISIFFISFLSSKITWKAFQKLGEVSYGFYLIHVPVLAYLSIYSNNNLITATCAFVITLLLSLLSNKYYESLFYSR